MFYVIHEFCNLSINSFDVMMEGFYIFNTRTFTKE